MWFRTCSDDYQVTPYKSSKHANMLKDKIMPRLAIRPEYSADRVL
jgi:hypothetical protein